MVRRPRTQALPSGWLGRYAPEGRTNLARQFSYRLAHPLSLCATTHPTGLPCLVTRAAFLPCAILVQYTVCVPLLALLPAGCRFAQLAPHVRTCAHLALLSAVYVCASAACAGCMF
eukprot:scaffold18575_cov104-Isochrysis_galbana.AAC.2